MKSEGINIIAARYVGTAVKRDQYPEGEWGEIAFIGRSNVGKSSLINSLARHGGLARTSGTPGKTQTINFYRLTAKYEDDTRQEFFLVDLPGYGYARTGRAARRQWSKFVEEYFLTSKRLLLVCQLIDIRHPPMESDLETFRWLTGHGLKVQIIATKADKLSRMHIKRHSDVISRELGMTAGMVLPYSSASGAGRSELLALIGKEIRQC
ncbi:MAG: ribosome biogenesis GTP-binding protein YihA/YsxC [Negativicutes bacterium]|nr:ribosome biogenesis GTP-binding protein YihA/YsxC [Negativicutes bacterium]